ncbi:alanine racemase [Aliihoeflea sp. PC F10.4]
MPFRERDITGPDPRLAGGRLSIDVAALAANYRLLAAKAHPARSAGVVKANAYGLGLDVVAPVLWAEGCRIFFVALPHEGIALRGLLPEAEIYVLAGLFESHAAQAYGEAELIPVLNDETDISIWEAYGWDGEDVSRPCAIHVDTGMNRLGLTDAQLNRFFHENKLTRALSPRLLMSHLACADDPSSPMNQRQLESFQTFDRLFSGIDSSLANSSGIFLGDHYAFDIVRPGIALYGGAPQTGTANPMRPVATVEARIVQVRSAKADDTVGYGAPQALERDTIIAVAASGYADGLHRSMSGAGVPLRDALPAGGHGFIAGKRVPILGRITMDLTLFDVTDLGPGAVNHGDWIELFGPNITIDEAAAAAGTIPYELLTSLGARYHRHVVNRDRRTDG